MKTFVLPAGRLMNKAFAEKGDFSVIKWEVINIFDGEVLNLKFESASSPWRQGIWFATDNGVFINGEEEKSAVLWYDSAPQEVNIRCRTNDGKFHLYNVWNRGVGKNSQAMTSGMRAEDISVGTRYTCNDIGFTDTFDKLIFVLSRSSETK